jgi:hypothetical protein
LTLDQQNLRLVIRASSSPVRIGRCCMPPRDQRHKALAGRTSDVFCRNNDRPYSRKQVARFLSHEIPYLSARLIQINAHISVTGSVERATTKNIVLLDQGSETPEGPTTERSRIGEEVQSVGRRNRTLDTHAVREVSHSRHGRRLGARIRGCETVWGPRTVFAASRRASYADWRK